MKTTGGAIALCTLAALVWIAVTAPIVVAYVAIGVCVAFAAWSAVMAVHYYREAGRR